MCERAGGIIGQNQVRLSGDRLGMRVTNSHGTESVLFGVRNIARMGLQIKLVLMSMGVGGGGIVFLTCWGLLVAGRGGIRTCTRIPSGGFWG